MTLMTGARLGVYEISALLGAGGMGEVYRARDTKLGRDVAIKVLPSLVAADPDRLARFEREARLLATLNHPNIGAIYGVEESSGVIALVLELVDGETLAAKLQGVGARGLGLAEALKIARQIADALDAAHERGIVHRDLKPANIVFTSEGIVKVLDFGLAKAAGTAGGAGGSDEQLTHSPTVIGPTLDGVLLGTAPYMSPEQARGKVVDKRSDIWAFGCVLYEMLTGRRAFSGETTSDTIAAILDRGPDWICLPSTTPDRIRELLRSCLDKDPKCRLRDIGDAHSALDTPEAAQDSVRRGPPGARRAAIGGAAAAAIVAALLTATVLRLMNSGGDQGRRPSMAQTIASRLTNYGGTEGEASLSPDGRSFVFVSDHGGTPDIWRRQVSGGDPVRLTNDAVEELNPVFTPDGDAIYFGRLESSGAAIWRMGALGGQAQKILGGVSTSAGPVLISTAAPLFALSHDGRALAVYDGASLVICGSDGGGRRVLATGILSSLGHPSWSPDDRLVSYVRGGLFAPSNLFVVDVRSGKERQVSHFKRSVEGVGSHAWLPDGRHIVVSYVPFTRQQGPQDLGILDVTDGSIERLTMTVNDALTDPALSADGLRMLVTAASYDREVWRLPLGPDADANGRAATRLMDSSRDPMWTFVSRDGRTLLFNSPASGSRNLWTAPLDVSAPPRQITAIANDAIAHSSLSPDGTRVAFASNATGNSDIWTQNVDGTELRQLTDDTAADSWPVWSPDGRSIVFSSLHGTQETWRVSADGGPAVKLFDGFFRGDWIVNPAGGTRIVTSDGGGGLRLLDVDHRSIVWTRRVSAGGTLSLPLFSADGRHISLPLPERRDRDAIWIFDTATGDGRIAVRFPEPMRILFRASWIDHDAALVVNSYRLRTHIELYDRFWSGGGAR